MLPRWAYGFWQSRQRYTNQKELVDVVSRISQAQDPARQHRARLVLLEGRFLGFARVRPGAFPRSQGHDRQGARAERAPDDLGLAEVLPDHGNYKELDAAGFMYRGNIEAGALGLGGQGLHRIRSTIRTRNPRATCTGARSTRSSTCSASMRGGWTPPSRICTRTSTSIRIKARIGPTAMGPAEQFFNSYPLVHTGGVYEGARAARPGQARVHPHALGHSRASSAMRRRCGAATSFRAGTICTTRSPRA